MPAKSKAQYKKMFVLRRQGKISEEELKKFTHGVNYKSLPKKVKDRKRKKRVAKKRGGGKKRGK